MKIDAHSPEDALRPAPPRISPRLLARYGLLFGLLMILVAWLWTGVVRGQPLAGWFPADRWAPDLLIGLAIGGGFALGAWRLLAHIPALRRIEQVLLSTLDMRALRFRHALIFGLLAGIPEEILFRGAIQPVAGWLAASILFGALHSITPAYFVYATLAGGLLGWLGEWRDGLWAPIAAHTAIDVIMFALLIRKWRQTHRSTTSSVPTPLNLP